MKLNLPYIGPITVELPYLAGGAVVTLAALSALGYWVWFKQPTTVACEPKDNFEVTAEDFAEGDPKAPITLIEYASMTCPHCARFNNEVLPRIKKTYVDTGHVRYVFREFPIGQVAMTISVIGRCLAHDKYLPFVDAVYRTQEQWGNSKSGEELKNAMVKLAQDAGMKPEDFDKCLADGQKHADAIVKVATKAVTDYCVNGTPSMFMNGKVFSTGELPFAEAEQKLRDELTALGKTLPPPAPPPAPPEPKSAAPPAEQPPAEGAAPPMPAPSPAEQPPADSMPAPPPPAEPAPREPTH